MPLYVCGGGGLICLNEKSTTRVSVLEGRKQCILKRTHPLYLEICTMKWGAPLLHAPDARNEEEDEY